MKNSSLALLIIVLACWYLLICIWAVKSIGENQLKTFSSGGILEKDFMVAE